MKLLRHPTLWGAAALVLATIVGLVAAWLYISPPGQKTVTFYTNDAASIHPGDQVRIAGIPVGKIKELTLEPDRVRVRARIDGYAFVGDQSQVQVRMLTVVGGYYVNIVSLGDVALGTKAIPVERVTMPYNLMQTLADATKITDKVDAKPLKESLDQLQNGLSGENVKSLSAIIDAGNSLMSTIEKQRGQTTAILNFSNEYIGALNNFGDGLRTLVRKASIAEQTLDLYSAQFGNTLSTMGHIFSQLAPTWQFYVNHRDKFLEKARGWLERARMWAEQNGVIIRGLREIRNKIERVLDAQNAPPELLATDMCMPVPGSPC
ncbi:MlaD family protein [Mycobacterium avium]|uniref:MlaD family protein n=1 Tax=Mycobacterium avium TaxID=1764 RepID=UPI001CC77969|nr:MlaD family protein [Mycobacterium avium]MBZ4521813.1 MCE family protein [Mycobacterium avium subsp. hominissuis]MBZ4531175.1 MCE family protein [Mycobacterium avium subsp. hominissuis]